MGTTTLIIFLISARPGDAQLQGVDQAENPIDHCAYNNDMVGNGFRSDMAELIDSGLKLDSGISLPDPMMDSPPLGRDPPRGRRYMSASNSVHIYIEKKII